MKFKNIFGGIEGKTFFLNGLKSKNEFLKKQSVNLII